MLPFMAAAKRPGADRGRATSTVNGTPAPAGATATRDLRPWIYAGIDLVFAVLYIVLAYGVLPIAGASFHGISVALGVAALAAGLGTAVRRPWGWWAGVFGSATVLVMGVGIIVLLVLAAAYLKGIYGAVGRGAALGSLVVAALAIEVYCLWPLFQLRYLLSRAGRRGAGRPAGAA